VDTVLARLAALFLDRRAAAFEGILVIAPTVYVLLPPE
jgi:hypothetical protein